MGLKSNYASHSHESVKSFSGSKFQDKMDCQPLSLLLFNIVLEVLTSTIRQQKEIKAPELAKKSNSHSSQRTWYSMWKTQDSTPNHQNAYRNSAKWQDIKSMHRNPLHSYTLTMRQKKREIREPIPFPIAPKAIRQLGMNLTKEAKDLYSEN